MHLKKSKIMFSIYGKPLIIYINHSITERVKPILNNKNGWKNQYNKICFRICYSKLLVLN